MGGREVTSSVSLARDPCVWRAVRTLQVRIANLERLESGNEKLCGCARRDAPLTRVISMQATVTYGMACSLLPSRACIGCSRGFASVGNPRFPSLWRYTNNSNWRISSVWWPNAKR
eukprot:917129-Amphidinium_carterae.1